MKSIVIISFLVLIATGCKKTTAKSNLNPYYLNATVDGHVWNVTGLGQAYFMTYYDYNKQRFTLNIFGESDQDTNTLARGIDLGFDFIPKPGRYYFNNMGSDQSDSGTIAVYTYYDINHDYYKWSNSGYVDIDSISKNVITGSFSFTAQGDATDTTTAHITAGSFEVITAGWTGMEWPGP